MLISFNNPRDEIKYVKEMNSKGAVPVPYIIALILGAMVLGFITYSLFYSNSEFSKSMRERKCEYQKVMYCNLQDRSGYDGFAPAQCCENNDDECVKADYYAHDCCEFSWASSIDCSV